MAHGFSVSRIHPNQTPIPFSRRGAKARRKIITGYTFQWVSRTRTTFRSVSIGVHAWFIGSSLAPDELEHMDAVALHSIPRSRRHGQEPRIHSLTEISAILGCVQSTLDIPLRNPAKNSSHPPAGIRIPGTAPNTFSESPANRQSAHRS